VTWSSSTDDSLFRVLVVMIGGGTGCGDRMMPRRVEIHTTETVARSANRDGGIALDDWWSKNKRLPCGERFSNFCPHRKSNMKLTPLTKKFILHWGEMGTRWGINRTMAQVHALIYIAPRPLHAEEITEILSVARSNVSTCLRELQNWGLVKVVHVLGDRRDHFETYKDVWQMFQVVMKERMKREIEPTMALLREAVNETDSAGKDDDVARERLTAMLEFFDSATSCFADIEKLSPSTLRKLMKMGGKVSKLIGS
jgi:DNA-binding transcriptional regulator GbsR (MarR family)